MMQTLNPYTSARTAEIMARYRPIAPKPESPVSNPGDNSPNSMPQNIRKSPYLMNVWPHLQARPTRTRKRGRTALAPPPGLKRSRTCLQGLSPPYQVTASPAKTLALQGFIHDPSSSGLPPPHLSFNNIPNLVPLKCGLETPSNSVTIPLLPGSDQPPPGMSAINGVKLLGESERGRIIIDLNKAVEDPQELDLLPQLEGPTKSVVITPQAIRPVGSSISVRRISSCEDEEDTYDRSRNAAAKKVMKKPEEVEKDVESESLPAVVSDSNNRVRLTNPAYNEMVGQPECCWLDYMYCGGGDRSSGACKRIGGEVLLDFMDSSNIPLPSNGFTCWVRIEWCDNKNSNKKKCFVNAFCDAIRLACESKDYVFEWRFHIREASDSASNV